MMSDTCSNLCCTVSQSMNNDFLKILVVEDSEALADNYKNILESKGHRVYIAHDGQEEIEIYENEIKRSSGKPPFDLIISDNSMPKMNGVEAGKKILSYVPDQKFFFVTGEKTTVLDSFNVDGKNIDVEQKPVSAEVFIRKIEFLTKK